MDVWDLDPKPQPVLRATLRWTGLRIQPRTPNELSHILFLFSLVQIDHPEGSITDQTG